jgi:monoamine oxidase
MGPRPALTRRRLLLGAAATTLAACGRDERAAWQGAWVGAEHARGHRLRTTAPTFDVHGSVRRAAVLVVGGGIAGLAAARGFLRRGIDDVHVLELEDTPGGNSRGHTIAGMACPLGAHYLPPPPATAHEVAEWLHEIGLLRTEHGRTRAEERHLCHSPQERLFYEGEWHDGLLPPAEPSSAALAQYRRYAAAVAAAGAFTIPAHRAPWSAARAALDATTFAAWLGAQGLDDERLRWYLDYCCRDDYGAGIDTVSAWAGLHYFASRHGFHAPGDSDAEREAVFTWPEGNAWLVQRLAAPLAGRMHGGRVVARVREGRHGVDVLALHGERVERWQAGTVVLALPLFIAARVLENAPAALHETASFTRYAPWLVANLHVERALVDRPGVAPAWDNVAYGQGLGYVDAMHQSLRPGGAATVLTAYAELPAGERPALLGHDWRPWATRVVDNLAQIHPDLPAKVTRVDLMRYGHAMAVPVPGLHGERQRSARAALRGGSGRVRYAHADLAGYSIFEEAFTAGCDAAVAPSRRLGS